mmetsp:Transcript_6741/g.21413  ORF Transcript_6741/g.21413 Transcript_6741/m.21413 type:complete len:388 (+) Transcript_6741:632-1795(+)
MRRMRASTRSRSSSPSPCAKSLRRCPLTRSRSPSITVNIASDVAQQKYLKSGEVLVAARRKKLPIQWRGSYLMRSAAQFSLNCSAAYMRSLSVGTAAPLAAPLPAPLAECAALLPAAALHPGSRLTTRQLMADTSPSASASVACAKPRRSQKACSAARSSTVRNVGRRSGSAESDASHASTSSAAACSTDLRVAKSASSSCCASSSSSPATAAAPSASSAAPARPPLSSPPMPTAASSARASSLSVLKLALPCASSAADGIGGSTLGSSSSSDGSSDAVASTSVGGPSSSRFAARKDADASLMAYCSSFCTSGRRCQSTCSTPFSWASSLFKTRPLQQRAKSSSRLRTDALPTRSTSAASGASSMIIAASKTDGPGAPAWWLRPASG